MTDPLDALNSFQVAFAAKSLALRRCALDPDLWVFADEVNGLARMTYARSVGKEIVAFVNFVEGEPFEGTPCVHIGWAVPLPHRNQGLATRTVRSALAEMAAGFGPYGPFHVEAVVGLDNLASQRVAERTISSAPTPITDGLSGLPALVYRRRCALEP